MARLRGAAAGLALLLAAGGAVFAWTRLGTGRDVRPVLRSAAWVGDVVFFRTTTWRGRIVRLFQFDMDDDFAHVGVVVRVTPDVLVAHACPTEPAAVRIDRLDELLMRDEITAAAVFRPRADDAEATAAATIAEDYARRAIPFDFDFELADDRAVYCTELVWLAYRSAGLKIGTTGRILFPADLLQGGFFAER